MIAERWEYWESESPAFELDLDELTGGESPEDDLPFFFIPDGKDNSSETSAVKLGHDLDLALNE
jgi:hypothetical protein